MPVKKTTSKKIISAAEDEAKKEALPFSMPACSEKSPQDFSKSFMYSVHQLQFLVEKRLEQVLSINGGISFSQFMILVGFECSSNGPVSQSCIASTLYLTEATVSRHVSVLTKLGLLSQVSDPKNRRKHIITITSKGKTAFIKANTIVTKELDALFSVINIDDRSRIMKNFSKVLPELLAKK